MHVPVNEAKTTLSKLIEAVERGDRVVVTRHNTPVVELVPVRPSGVRLGSLAHLGAVPDAFLAPMTDDELREWDAI